MVTGTATSGTIQHRRKSQSRSSSETLSRPAIRRELRSAVSRRARDFAFRNQSDEAFELLDRAYAKHDDGLIFTKVEPLLKSLHDDPRYTALLKCPGVDVRHFLWPPESGNSGQG